MNLEKQSYKSNFKQKVKSKPVAKEVRKLPSDRQILDTLSSHYGTPKNIVKEKVKLYI